VVRGLGIGHPGVGASARVTISVGVASAVPNSNDSAQALVEKADGALYAAKKAGRDRVRSAG
ncbi:MAG: GGDEF domain-containing protein, partial [Chthoniobacterales bacterium]